MNVSKLQKCTWLFVGFLLLYMLLRIFKYRCAVEPVLLRYTVYAYWIPQMMVPALFLMTCIRIRGRRKADGKRWEALLLIPAALLALIVMTNDLHGLVYTPKMELTGFSVDSGTYKLGPVIYLLHGWMVLTAVPGLVLLFRETGHLEKKVIRDLVCVVALWFGIVLFDILYLDHHTIYRMYNVPEAHTFGLLGIFEVCIRYRLIPYNENYSGFFRALQMPVLITDREYKRAYSSEIGLRAEKEDLRNALESPVSLAEDMKLHGKEIRATRHDED